LLVALLLPCVAAASWPDCSPEADGHMPNNGTAGPFGEVAKYTTIFEGHPIVVIHTVNPTPVPAPLFVFMHGSTGAIEMYEENLRNYASHGFVVAFPYIKDPSSDRNPLTTNTNGEYILKAVDFVNQSSTTNSSSPIFGRVDMSSIVLAGHSMGATCSIISGTRAPTDARVPKDSVKLVVTQHPGICGPFGPPPWPSTWLESDLANVVGTYPLLFTTATNDGAFWPAPQTAEHEKGCYNGALPEDGNFSNPATFVQFSATACDEDGMHPPWTDSGHDCPFKTGVENPWVQTAIKLYTHMEGNMDSQCAKMLYGKTDSSLENDSNVETVEFRSRPKF